MIRKLFYTSFFALIAGNTSLNATLARVERQTELTDTEHHLATSVALNESNPGHGATLQDPTDQDDYRDEKIESDHNDDLALNRIKGCLGRIVQEDNKEPYLSINLTEDIYSLWLGTILKKKNDLPSIDVIDLVNVNATTLLIFFTQVVSMLSIFPFLLEDVRDGSVVQESIIECNDNIRYEGCTVGDNRWDRNDEEVVNARAVAMFIAYSVVWANLQSNVLQVSRLSILGGDIVQSEKSLPKICLKTFSAFSVLGTQISIVMTMFQLMTFISGRAAPFLDPILDGIGLVILNEIDDIACQAFLKSQPFKAESSDMSVASSLRSDFQDNFFQYSIHQNNLKGLAFSHLNRLKINDLVARLGLFMIVMGEYLSSALWNRVDGGAAKTATRVIGTTMIFLPPTAHFLLAVLKRCRTEGLISNNCCSFLPRISVRIPS